MISYIWPIALVIFSNTVYQICAKGIPEEVSPFASLAVTYTIGAAVSVVLHLLLRPGDGIFKEFAKMNWAPFVLGLVIVGLEVGWIYAYQAGWPVSTGMIVESAILAAVLIFVGRALYHEPVTWNKLLGIVICLVGLVFINLK